jgi:undecaprenyl-diphosphatase
MLGGIWMGLSWLQSLLYGLISGLTEIFPVSAQAHQALMLRFIGVADEGNMTGFVVRATVLMVLFLNCRDHIEQLRREQQLQSLPARRRKRQPDARRVLELRMLKSAVVPALLGFLFYVMLRQNDRDLLMISVFLAFNGIALFYPQRVRSGNKDARSMSGFDSILLGISCSLGMIPGLSRIGLVTSAAAVRGADKEHSLNWALLLSLPVFLVYLLFDAVAVVSSGNDAFGVMAILGYVLAALGAFLGASLSLHMMRSFSRKIGFSGFAYYCWGAALFTFIMYLSI